MNRVIRVSIVLSVLAVLGFGMGATQLGHFFLKIGETEAVAEREPAAGPVTDNLRDIFVELSRRLVPSVVNIYTTQTVKSPYGGGPQGDLYRRFFEQFFGEDFDGMPPGMPPGGPSGPGRKAQSLGTGFVIDEKEGLILTNNHVIAEADEIKVILTEEDADRDGVDAAVVGADPEADVALIKIKVDRKLQAAPLGDSDALQVGEWVMAIGNPFGHGHTVTKGIISAKERVITPISQFANYIQTDTPINPGNSGGPLINTAGQVIGINTAINAAAQGIGFAIPINYVKRLLPELRTKGQVTRGFIGVNLSELNPQIARQLKLPKGATGALVAEVFPGNPAAKAGVRAYDVVVSINGKKITNERQLVSAVTQTEPGTTIDMVVLRKGEEKSLKVTVGKRPVREEIASRSRGSQGGPGRPRLDIGMVVEEVDAEVRSQLGLPGSVKGVVVTGVQPGGPADEAGLAQGDVIVEVDQRPTPNLRVFNAQFRQKRAYVIRFRRGSGLAITSLDLSAS
jgi:serine protease Do